MVTGDIDRAALANLVFSDMEALKKLNNILHPLVMDNSCNGVKRKLKSLLWSMNQPLSLSMDFRIISIK